MVKPPSSLFSTSLVLLTVITGTTACTQQPAIQSEATDQSQESSPWEAISQLPTSLESHKMVALGDFVYVIGGWNETKGVHAEVFFAPLTPEGTLGDWQEATAAMPLKLQHHEVITHNNGIYVLGGDNGFWEGSSVSDRIFRAVPDSQGNILEWTDVGQLPEPLTIHAATTIGDQVYILGGSRTFRPGNTPVIDSIFTSTITPDGAFNAFQPLTPFPTPIGWVTATAIERRIFAISGNTQFSPARLAEQVWATDVAPDGQLSPFETIGTTVPRRRHATVLVDRTLVVIAGGGAKGALSTVEAAEVDAQGNLSPWTELAPLPETLYAHAAFARNGYIYVSGGFLRYGSNDTSRQVFRLPFKVN